METCFAAYCVMELDELLEDFIILKVPQGLIFDIAINVGEGHVQVFSTLAEYSYLHTLILFHKVDEVSHQLCRPSYTGGSQHHHRCCC